MQALILAIHDQQCAATVITLFQLGRVKFLKFLGLRTLLAEFDQYWGCELGGWCRAVPLWPFFWGLLGLVNSYGSLHFDSGCSLDRPPTFDVPTYHQAGNFQPDLVHWWMGSQSSWCPGRCGREDSCPECWKDSEKFPFVFSMALLAWIPSLRVNLCNNGLCSENRTACQFFSINFSEFFTWGKLCVVGTTRITVGAYSHEAFAYPYSHEVAYLALVTYLCSHEAPRPSYTLVAYYTFLGSDPNGWRTGGKRRG